VPLVDTVAIAGVQYVMIQQLAQLYEVEFKEHRAKSIFAAFMGSVGTISGLKFIPKIGTVLGGISTSTIGAASTYAVGQVFMQHFDQGGTLLDFDPAASRIYFEQELEKGKEVVAKLKEEAYLSTSKGRQEVVHQLVADNDQCLLILKQLQEDLANYEVQEAEPIKIVSLPTAPEIEQVPQLETSLSFQDIQDNIQNIQEATTTKNSWWISLKEWFSKKIKRPK